MSAREAIDRIISEIEDAIAKLDDKERHEFLRAIDVWIVNNS